MLETCGNFCIDTGWRINSEVLSLQWHQIDFEAGAISLEPGTTKNDKGRLFPFTQELRYLLEAQRTRTDALKKHGLICPWVFHRKSGKQIKDFRKAWKKAMKTPGFPEGFRTISGERPFGTFFGLGPRRQWQCN
jgi:integrase